MTQHVRSSERSGAERVTGKGGGRRESEREEREGEKERGERGRWIDRLFD